MATVTTGKNMVVECISCRVKTVVKSRFDPDLDDWKKVTEADGSKITNGKVKNDRTHLGWCAQCVRKFRVE